MIDYKYIFLLLIFILLHYYREKFIAYDNENTSKHYYDMVNQFLINNNNGHLESLAKNNKPCLWIHIHNDNTIIPSTNQRSWINFYSRNTTNFNQPYQLLTIKSIIDKCSDDFNICIIDDNSFLKIIPNWTIDISKMANPLKTRMRTLALCRLLNIYGGLIAPSSFVCLRNLKPLYNLCKRNDKLIVGDFVNRTNFNSSIEQNLVPYLHFMISEPNNPILLEFISYQESLYSRDFTSDMDFNGKINQWLYTANQDEKIEILDGKYIGTKDKDDNVVIVDDLVSSTLLELHNDSYGLYIPWNELIIRTALSWFVYLSVEEVLDSNTNIGKYLLFSITNV
jgi:hypothetical protein